jgi:hypothetical protein
MGTVMAVYMLLMLNTSDGIQIHFWNNRYLAKAFKYCKTAVSVPAFLLVMIVWCVIWVKKKT